MRKLCRQRVLSMCLWAGVLATLQYPCVGAEDVSDHPRPVPVTRPMMKHVLESLKQRTPRIQLPEQTAAEKLESSEALNSYEPRLRKLYLPKSDSQSAYGFLRDPDPKMTLDYVFKTKMFWIVSRTNNCHYCLGHQEIKLAVAGVLENEIATLDGDWSNLRPEERAAYAFARKLTWEPQRIGDADIDNLRKYYSDLQILEIIFSLAGNNAINRWKEGVGVPQEAEASRFLLRADRPVPQNRPLPIKSLETPTAPEFATLTTQVAPHVLDAAAVDSKGQLALPVCERSPLTANEAIEGLNAAAHRSARLPVLTEETAQQVVGDAWGGKPLPQWVRLLANFPVHGVARIRAGREAEEGGDLTPLLKAQLSWVIASQDRAWYALGEARGRLRKLGQTDEQIYALGGDRSELDERTRALLILAEHLAGSPIMLTDRDFQTAVELAGPRDTVQVVHYTTLRASFDRITEAAGLPLDSE